MPVTIAEWFGFRAEDRSALSLSHAESGTCPFTERTCIKVLKGDSQPSGVCSLARLDGSKVICCPNRLYGDSWKILEDVAEIAFGPGFELVIGRSAQQIASRIDRTVVGVFGKYWGGELPIPKRGGKGAYYVDWVLALISPSGLDRFVAVEVQTIDTTGNYHDSLNALRADRNVVKSGAGFNWENVNKRILPQLMQKGQVLERESHCKEGLFFVTPEPVLQQILTRLTGDQHDLPRYPLAPGSITFLSYDANLELPADGKPLQLVQRTRFTTSVNQIAQALATPRALPEPDVYSRAIAGAQVQPIVVPVD